MPMVNCRAYIHCHDAQLLSGMIPVALWAPVSGSQVSELEMEILFPFRVLADEWQLCLLLWFTSGLFFRFIRGEKEKHWHDQVMSESVAMERLLKVDYSTVYSVSINHLFKIYSREL